MLEENGVENEVLGLNLMVHLSTFLGTLRKITGHVRKGSGCQRSGCVRRRQDKKL